MTTDRPFLVFLGLSPVTRRSVAVNKTFSMFMTLKKSARPSSSSWTERGAGQRPLCDLRGHPHSQIEIE